MRAIELLWAYDPDPGATLTVQAAIDAALAAGDITRTTARGKSLGYQSTTAIPRATTDAPPAARGSNAAPNKRQTARR